MTGTIESETGVDVVPDKLKKQTDKGLGQPIMVCVMMLALLVVELYVYQPSLNGFFFGDSIAQIAQRPRTVSEALASFGEVHGWYRPLSQRVCHFLLYPLFGFTFLPYHLLALFLHMLTSVLIYFALLRLFRSVWAAFVGAWFFGVHSINFYTTYDAAFFAEPILVGAYVGGIWSFLKQRYWLTFACLCLALASKETGVTLLPVLVALFLTIGYQKPELRKRQLLFLASAMILLVAYMAVYIRHFEIRGSSISSNAGGPNYRLSVNRNVLENYKNYTKWVFQMPRTWMTDRWVSDQRTMLVQAALAVTVAVFAILRVLRDNNIRLGLLVFMFAPLPTLLLVDSFVHHAYLPLVGISVILGCLVLTAQTYLPRPLLALLLLILLPYQASIARQNVRQDNLFSWVGHAAMGAKQAAATINTVKGRLQTGAPLVIINQTSQSLDFAIGGTSLARLVTGNDDLDVEIVDGSELSLQSLPRNSIILRYDGQTLHTP